jgi:hypothetical protein
MRSKVHQKGCAVYGSILGGLLRRRRGHGLIWLLVLIVVLVVLFGHHGATI